jgi:hypothetical protein
MTYDCDNVQTVTHTPTVGGVALSGAGGSDGGGVGAAWMAFDRTDAGPLSSNKPVRLTAFKAWFGVDEGIIAAGAGIAVDAPANVTTAVEQSLLQGDVIMTRQSAPGAYVTVSPGSWLCEGDVLSLTHAALTYVFPGGAPVCVSTLNATGAWVNITQNGNATLTAPVFTAFIAHGVLTPSSPAGSYVYAVLPGLGPTLAPAVADFVARLAVQSLGQGGAAVIALCLQNGPGAAAGWAQMVASSAPSASIPATPGCAATGLSLPGGLVGTQATAAGGQRTRVAVSNWQSWPKPTTLSATWSGPSVPAWTGGGGAGNGTCIPAGGGGGGGGIALPLPVSPPSAVGRSVEQACW